MRLIDRYLGKTILQSILLVMLAIAGIETFILMIGELGDIGHGDYTTLSAFYFVLLSLPDQLYQFFPMACLIGMLMAFGLLASHSELVIFQSAGMSAFHITLSALKTIVLLLIVMAVVGEVIAPEMSSTATHFKAVQLQNDDNSIQVFNVWLRFKDDYLHIEKMDKQNVLRNLTWYHFSPEGQLLSANIVESAVYKEGQWQGENVQQTHFSDQRLTAIHSKTAPLPFTITPDVLINNTQSPSQLSLRDLQKSLRFNKDNHAIDNSIQLNFWRRILQPIASLVMVLLAIPCIFGPLRNASASFRLAIGIALGLFFYYLNQLFGPIALLFHWPPLLGALLPMLIFGCVGILVLNLNHNR